MEYKIIIAGGRDFSDYQVLEKFCDDCISNIAQKNMEQNVDITILSGTAKGADQLGEQYAANRGYNIKRFPPDWNKHGKAAGPIRNREMAEYANSLIAFWDRKSSGTKNMIAEALKRNLEVFEYYY